MHGLFFHAPITLHRVLVSNIALPVGSFASAPSTLPIRTWEDSARRPVGTAGRDRLSSFSCLGLHKRRRHWETRAGRMAGQRRRQRLECRGIPLEWGFSRDTEPVAYLSVILSKELAVGSCANRGWSAKSAELMFSVCPVGIQKLEADVESGRAHDPVCRLSGGGVNAAVQRSSLLIGYYFFACLNIFVQNFTFWILWHCDSENEIVPTPSELLMFAGEYHYLVTCLNYFCKDYLCHV